MTLKQFCKLICNPIFILVWATVAVLSYFYWDQAVTRFFHTLVQTHPIFFAIGRGFSFVAFGSTSILTLLALMVLSLLIKRKDLAVIFMFALLSLLFSGIICDIIKLIVNRARPAELFWNQHPLYGFYFWKFHPYMNSFPSGHATVITSVMLALSMAWPRAWKLLMLLALLVSLSRLVVLMHYVSDVMAGMLLASLSTVYLRYLLSRFRFRTLLLPERLWHGISSQGFLG